MGSGSRIRWRKVAKLALGVLGCLALVVGLPSLIRRPEPPPLEPDIGLAHLATSREPAHSTQRPAPGPDRRDAKTQGRPGGRACRPASALTRRIRLRRMTGRLRLPGSRRRGFRRSCSGTRSQGRRRHAGAGRPTRRERGQPSTGSTVTDVSAQVPVPPAGAAPPPPTAPLRAQAQAPQPAVASEFGFER